MGKNKDFKGIFQVQAHPIILFLIYFLNRIFHFHIPSLIITFFPFPLIPLQTEGAGSYFETKGGQKPISESHYCSINNHIAQQPQTGRKQTTDCTVLQVGGYFELIVSKCTQAYYIP